MELRYRIQYFNQEGAEIMNTLVTLAALDLHLENEVIDALLLDANCVGVCVTRDNPIKVVVTDLLKYHSWLNYWQSIHSNHHTGYTVTTNPSD